MKPNTVLSCDGCDKCDNLGDKYYRMLGKLENELSLILNPLSTECQAKRQNALAKYDQGIGTWEEYEMAVKEGYNDFSKKAEPLYAEHSRKLKRLADQYLSRKRKVHAK
jgi:hypothetical protein